MKIIKFKGTPYEIVDYGNTNSGLRVNNGSPWTEADTQSAEITMIEDIIQMRKLLHMSYNAKGLIQMCDVDDKIAQYIDSLPK